MSQTKEFEVSLAEPSDVEAVKLLADMHRSELGFVLRPSLVDSIGRGAILIARPRKGGSAVGFVHFRHRKDRCTKVYQICVAPTYRNRGIGSDLMGELKRRTLKAGQLSIILQCPEDLPANFFYEARGFNSQAVAAGRKRKLIIWSLPLGQVTDLVPEAQNADGC